jgi:hypothetical protein
MAMNQRPFVCKLTDYMLVMLATVNSWNPANDKKIMQNVDDGLAAQPSRYKTDIFRVDSIKCWHLTTQSKPLMGEVSALGVFH